AVDRHDLLDLLSRALWTVDLRLRIASLVDLRVEAVKPVGDEDHGGPAERLDLLHQRLLAGDGVVDDDPAGRRTRERHHTGAAALRDVAFDAPEVVREFFERPMGENGPGVEGLRHGPGFLSWARVAAPAKVALSPMDSTPTAFAPRRNCYDCHKP